MLQMKVDVIRNSMRYCFVFLLVMMCSVFDGKAQVDPHFQIYLCFGQSNMEGGSPYEASDLQGVDPRFLTLPARDFGPKDAPTKLFGQWCTAIPPIASDSPVLGMADYFGRTMVAALPADYKVGVVEVAVGGADIRTFIPEMVTEDIKFPSGAAIEKYGGDLYSRLVYTAKLAKQSGVIKGILLHQGERNHGNVQWLQWVKTIYDRLLVDLELKATEVPLLVGEVVNETEGGQCADHNQVIAQLPTVIPTAHVISSVDCPADAVGLHFSALGYRIMGRRYATKMLELLGYPAKKDAAYTLPENLRRFYKVTGITSYSDIDLPQGSSFTIPVTVTFEDGHQENLPAEAVVTKIGTGLDVDGTMLKGVTSDRTKVTVNYTDFTGATVSSSFYANRLGSPKGMISDVVNRIMSGDNTVDAADIVRIISDKE